MIPLENSDAGGGILNRVRAGAASKAALQRTYDSAPSENDSYVFKQLCAIAEAPIKVDPPAPHEILGSKTCLVCGKETGKNKGFHRAFCSKSCWRRYLQGVGNLISLRASVDKSIRKQIPGMIVNFDDAVAEAAVARFEKEKTVPEPRDFALYDAASGIVVSAQVDMLNHFSSGVGRPSSAKEVDIAAWLIARKSWRGEILRKWCEEPERYHAEVSANFSLCAGLFLRSDGKFSKQGVEAVMTAVLTLAKSVRRADEEALEALRRRWTAAIVAPTIEKNVQHVVDYKSFDAKIRTPPGPVLLAELNRYREEESRWMKAEAERDALRKEKKDLEKTVRQKERAIDRLERELQKTDEVRRKLERLESVERAYDEAKSTIEEKNRRIREMAGEIERLRRSSAPEEPEAREEEPGRVPEIDEEALAGALAPLAAFDPKRLFAAAEALGGGDRFCYAEGAFDTETLSSLDEVGRRRLALAAIRMATTLWEIKFLENAGEIERRFRDASGFEISMKEKSLTSKSRDLMSQRRVVCEGRAYEAVPHVKVRGGANPLRIYFAFDEERGRIVVGRVTGHLDTAGTRRVK